MALAGRLLYGNARAFPGRGARPDSNLPPAKEVHPPPPLPPINPIIEGKGGRGKISFADGELESVHSPPTGKARALPYWRERISERWQESVQEIIDVGRLLLAAKAALKHGQFQNKVIG